jgi:hypothetical protein
MAHTYSVVSKQCTKCMYYMPLHMFDKNTTTKDGLQYWCKVCRSEHSHDKNGRKGSSKTLRCMTPTEYGWVAGIIEGEGTLFARIHHKKNTIAGIKVVSTDKDTVERLQLYTGVGTVSVAREATDKWKKLYRWESTRGKVTVDLLIGLLPMLGERRRAKAVDILGSVTYG